MPETIQLGEIVIAFTRKDIKHVHLSVHPPSGRVTLVGPKGTRSEVARAYAISKLGWIRDQQARLRAQARETPRLFVERESHHLWGRRYLLTVREEDAKPSIRLSHRTIMLTVRPGSNGPKRAAVVHEWHKSLLHGAVRELIARWEPKLGVGLGGYYLQRMKTRWGSCNHRARTIRLNTELVKKPKDLLEYVVLHEMLHLIEPTHSERFLALMSKHVRRWREARAELNELPLGARRGGCRSACARREHQAQRGRTRAPEERPRMAIPDFQSIMRPLARSPCRWPRTHQPGDARCDCRNARRHGRRTRSALAKRQATHVREQGGLGEVTPQECGTHRVAASGGLSNYR